MFSVFILLRNVLIPHPHPRQESIQGKGKVLSWGWNPRSLGNIFTSGDSRAFLGFWLRDGTRLGNSRELEAITGLLNPVWWCLTVRLWNSILSVEFPWLLVGLLWPLRVFSSLATRGWAVCETRCSGTPRGDQRTVIYVYFSVKFKPSYAST